MFRTPPAGFTCLARKEGLFVRIISDYIGSTKPAKLREFIYKIRNAVDPSIEVHLGEVPFNGVMQPESVFDCTKIVKDTGYSPLVAFEEGIAKTVEWLKEIGWKG